MVGRSRAIIYDASFHRDFIRGADFPPHGHIWGPIRGISGNISEPRTSSYYFQTPLSGQNTNTLKVQTLRYESSISRFRPRTGH